MVWRNGLPTDTSPETECEGLNIKQQCANWESKFFCLERGFIKGKKKSKNDVIGTVK